MNNREFVLWLWGFLSICEARPLSRRLLFIIRNHMNLVLAVDGAFGEFNQKIHARISEELEKSKPADDTKLFDELKEKVSARLIELEQQAA